MWTLKDASKAMRSLHSAKKKHDIEIAMCAGQAHWQNGMVERHIGVFKNIIDRLITEDITSFPTMLQTPRMWLDYRSLFWKPFIIRMLLVDTVDHPRLNG